MTLNPRQQQAVEHIEGPLLILAGAGSGKTRVLTHRTSHLLQQGKQPESILSVAFTNKAANEMKFRVAKELGEETASRLWISTFHSFCRYILRESLSDVDDFPINAEFMTPSPSVTRQILKEVIDQHLSPEDKELDIFKPYQVAQTISLLKNELVRPKFLSTGKYLTAYTDKDKVQSILNDEEKVGKEHLGLLTEIYSLYQKRLERMNAIDVDDTLLYTAILFIRHPHVLERFQDQFSYIQVDEYQDTNQVQYVIIKLLASKYRNLAVVGDDDQSIFKFRGADVRNILHFEQDYPDALKIKLEENYRSTQTILNAANQVIAHNTQKTPKIMFTSNPVGKNIQLHKATYSLDEAEFVARQIQTLRQETGRPYRDFAVFFRNNSDGSSVETVFPKFEIPYVMASESSFFDREEIRDILSYLQLIINPYDSYAFKRAVAAPKRGVGKTTIDKIVEIGLGDSLVELAKNPTAIPRVNQKTKEGLHSFASLMETYQEQAQHQSAGLLISRLVSDIQYIESFDKLEEYQRKEKESYLEKLASLAHEMEAKQGSTLLLESFLDDLLRLDVDAQIKEDDQFDRVTLSTVHSAKGLEFPYVFVINMREGSLPSQYSLTPLAIEEERRLAYVAMTRAEEELYFSYPMKYIEKIDKDTKEERDSIPSRFLSEFDSHLVEEI